MFGKSKLLKTGAQAKAVVVSADMGGLSNSKGEHRWKLDLRVQFDDGSTGEVSLHAYEASVGTAYGVGQIVPVRFDPKDRSKVEVDTEAMVAGRQAELQASRDRLIAASEQRLRDEI